MPKRTVLITGCSSGGLGSALATAFSEKDFHVYATMRNPSKADPVLASISNVEILPLDVTSSDSIAKCAETVSEKTGGRLDVLVNNAGGAFWMPLLDTDIGESKRLFDVNVWGMLGVSQAFGSMLVRSDYRGCLLNVCSIAGAVRMAWQGIYNASKAAETWLSETLRIELEPLGVRVLTAMVGEVETRIYANTGVGKPFSLPSTSYYRSISHIIAKSADGALQTNNEPAIVTARSLVGDVLKGRRGMVWRGGVAGTAKYAHWLMPQRLFEWMLHSSRGVYEIEPPVKSAILHKK